MREAPQFASLFSLTPIACQRGGSIEVPLVGRTFAQVEAALRWSGELMAAARARI